MKKLGVIFGLVLLFCGQWAYSQQFEIAVKANQVIPNKKIYLEYINVRGQAVKVDSLLPNTQKSVKFVGKVLDGGAFYLLNFFDVPNPQKILLILEGGEKLEVVADGLNSPEKQGKFSITGNSENVKYMLQIMEASKSLEEKVKGWNQELQKDPKAQARIEPLFQLAQKETLTKIKAMLPQMGTNLVALWATNFLPAETEFATLEAVGERFKNARPNHPQVKPFLENLKRMRGANVGADAPEISLPTPSGETLALSSLKGKYVLLDFWAS